MDVGVERDVLRMNGVRPEEADSDSRVGPGSENRTRFFALLGVAGGVEMPCGCGIAVWEPDRDREWEPMLLLRLFLRTAMGRSSSVMFGEALS